MVLTKIRLDLNNRGMRNAVADCQQMHRLVTGLFGTSRQESKILFRQNNAGIRTDLYICSDSFVEKDRILPGMTLLGERDVTEWVESMVEGGELSFDLLASPSKKTPKEGARNSQRRILRTDKERLDWLMRKAEQYGFDLLSVQELEAVRLSGQHSSEAGGSFTVNAYHYQGRLRIEDAEKFRAALTGGIGSGKAYGLGMLLLA